MPRMPELKKIQIQNFTPAAGVDVNSIKYSGQFISSVYFQEFLCFGGKKNLKLDIKKQVFYSF